MSLGQSMLTAAALVAITIIVMSTHRFVIQTKEDEIRSMAMRIGSDAAASLIQEALIKQFDVNAVTTYYQRASEFHSPSILGPSPSEASIVQLPDTLPYRSIANYNDFDDYTRYTRIAKTEAMDGFFLSCEVHYVQHSNLNLISTGQTYYKRIIVKVVNPYYMKGDTLTFSAIKSY